MKILGNKIYEICRTCGQPVQINKFLFGGLHLCRTNEEKAIPYELYLRIKKQFDKS